MSHGGKREGSGRKATGPGVEKVNLSLSKEVANALRIIAWGKRSRFVDEAIREKMEREKMERARSAGYYLELSRVLS
jgi:hypothetical protein